MQNKPKQVNILLHTTVVALLALLLAELIYQNAEAGTAPDSYLSHAGMLARLVFTNYFAGFQSVFIHC